MGLSIPLRELVEETYKSMTISGKRVLRLTGGTEETHLRIRNGFETLLGGDSELICLTIFNYSPEFMDYVKKELEINRSKYFLLVYPFSGGEEFKDLDYSIELGQIRIPDPLPS